MQISQLVARDAGRYGCSLTDGLACIDGLFTVAVSPWKPSLLNNSRGLFVLQVGCVAVYRLFSKPLATVYVGALFDAGKALRQQLAGCCSEGSTSLLLPVCLWASKDDYVKLPQI